MKWRITDNKIFFDCQAKLNYKENQAGVESSLLFVLWHFIKTHSYTFQFHFISAVLFQSFPIYYGHFYLYSSPFRDVLTSK